ncbi:MAG: succinate-semialdehyde dehydrogenase (NAD(P)+), partial [Promethearchaeota archaeon CR_4]
MNGGYVETPGDATTRVQRRIRCINPATLNPLGAVSATSPEAIGEVLARARKSQEKWQEKWQGIPLIDRIRLLKGAVRYVRNHVEDIAFTIASETGKPKIEAINSDLIAAMGVADFAIHKVSKVLRPYRIKDRVLALMCLLGRHSYIFPKPVGVVGIISPWNYPFGIPFGQTFMATAAGNAVILKPSTETPLAGVKIQEVFDQAGFPTGLVQAIPGAGNGIGNALVESGVDRIIFTGSVQVGKQIMARAAQRLTPVTLELGGKDAMIVFADADIARAVTAGTWGAFINSGQTCVGVKRIYVQESVQEEFISQFTEQVKKLK